MNTLIYNAFDEKSLKNVSLQFFLFSQLYRNGSALLFALEQTSNEPYGCLDVTAGARGSV